MTDTTTNLPIAADQIRSIVDRVERLQTEIDGLNDDKADIFREAKGNGLDTRALKEVIRLRRLDAQVRREREDMVDLYRAALGLD